MEPTELETRFIVRSVHELLNSETSQIHNWSQLRACCVNCMTKPSIAR